MISSAALAGVGRDRSGPGLVERRAVLDEAARLAELARHGHGSLLLLTGPTGVGRSALLDALARSEAARPMTVLRANCAADEATHPYAAARQLAGAGVEFGPGPDGAAPWELLREHAARRPMLLLVDDVQHADPPSLCWLSQLGRRLERLPVLAVVTERRRPGRTGGTPRFGQDLPAGAVHPHRLGPLTRGGVAELLAARLGRPAPEDLVDDCLRATGGTPLLLHALLNALLAELGTPGHPLGDTPGGAFQDAVGHWLRAAGEPVATAARILAQLSGHPTGGADLPTLAGDGTGRVADWLHGLRAHGMLQDGGAGRLDEFAHPWLRTAVLADWGQERRAEVHHGLAALLYDRGESEDLIAGHLLQTEVCGAEWAADVLIGAARTARRDGRTARAVRLFRRALREPLTGHRRGTVLLELGCQEVTLGPPESVTGTRHLAQAVRLHQSDEAVFEAANALGSALAGRGETAAALEVMEDLAERFADHPELARAVHAAAALIASHDGASWLQVVEGLRRIEARTPDGLAPAALGMLTEYEAASGALSAAEAAGRIEQLTTRTPDTFSRSYVNATAATLAQWADLLPLADRLVADGLSAHRGTPLHPAYQCLLSVRAESRMMRSQYALLLTELHSAENHLGVLALNNSHLTSQAVLALLETGCLTEARHLATAAGADAPGSEGSWEWNELLYARGLVELAAGRPTEALTALQECGRRQGERHAVSPIVTPWRSAAADCHLLLGQPGAAAELATEELGLARIWGTPRTIGRALRALGAATGGRQGLTTAGEAVDLLRADGLETELIPALLGLGRLLLGSGRRAAARDTLREAVTLAERTGALRLVAVGTELLLASGARPVKQRHTGAQALTDSEKRVCRLAAEGHSNPEIAELLHLALRTVETHLTNSFRKLGIRRRAEIAAQLAHDA
ncbi:LuxR C-terminal-related transcriptional regulator [Kitasatospora sp. CMC57]|uniref:HTH luxR-type domain-containing protein n=1 Tax=Kitasatospora sp. CMC57 TaxID=3231513 RepID=A0AB33K468_9ACTN